VSVKLFLDELVESNISYEKTGFLSKILLWIHDTKYGELDDLNYF